MGVWRRRVVTVAVAGLLLAGGCTAVPRGVPPAEPVAPLAGAAPVPMPLPAAPRTWSGDRVLGVVWRGAPGAESAELGWLDALSLRPRPGRRLSLGRYGALWAVAPDGSLAVLGDGGDSDDGSVLVVDLRRLRRVGTVRLGWPWQSPFAASWLGRSRVLLAGVGVTDAPEGDLAAAMVSVVDLAAGRVVARRRVVGALLAAGRLPDGLVMLLGGAESVGPARLVVVDGDGGMRAVRLPATAAGSLVPQDRGPGVGALRWQPGLAVDPVGRRAFVVGREAPVAEVDLRGLEVSWHWVDRRPGLLGRLAAWLLPAAEAKTAHGPVRRVVGGGGHDPAGQRPVRVGEHDPVPVEVEDADAAAETGDADQLRDGPLGVGQVRQRGDGQDHVEALVGEGQRLRLAHPQLDLAGDAVPLGQLGRHGQQAGAGVQPDDLARWADQPGDRAGDRAAAAAHLQHAAAGGDPGQVEVGGACRHLLGVPGAQLQQRGQLACPAVVGVGGVEPEVELPVAGVGRLGWVGSGVGHAEILAP